MRVSKRQDAFLISVTRQQTVRANSESVALALCYSANPMCVDTDPNLDRRRTALVAWEFPYVISNKPFHTHVFTHSEKEKRLPVGIVVAQEKPSVTFYTTTTKEWARDKTVHTVPQHRRKLDKAEHLQVMTYIDTPLAQDFKVEIQLNEKFLERGYLSLHDARSRSDVGRTLSRSFCLQIWNWSYRTR